MVDLNSAALRLSQQGYSADEIEAFPAEIERLRADVAVEVRRLDSILKRLREVPWFKMKAGQEDTTTYTDDCWTTAVLPELFEAIMEEGDE